MAKTEKEWNIGRKDHKCDLCGGKIPKGEEHKSWSLTPKDTIHWEGEFETYHLHKNCWKFEEYILEWAEGEGWNDDDISENIQEVFEAFPEEKWKGKKINGHLQWCEEDQKLAEKLVRETDWEEVSKKLAHSSDLSHEVSRSPSHSSQEPQPEG